MNFITALVASSLINIQQPVQPSQDEHTVDTESLEQIATDYLKLRFTDADFIQTTVVEKANGHKYDVYLAFSAESTPLNTCLVSMYSHEHQKIHVERISCVNYQKKVVYREYINSTIYK